MPNGVATTLGNFILDQIPYQTGALSADVPPQLNMIPPIAYSCAGNINPRPLTIEGPLSGETTGQGFPAHGNVGNLLDSLYWPFCGRARRVTKAMRIKITYPDPGGGPDIVEHILIGYEGQGGP